MFLNYGFIIVRSSVVKTNKQKQQNNKKKTLFSQVSIWTLPTKVNQTDEIELTKK